MKQICLRCSQIRGPECGEQHDPCIANCPRTRDACCGHGILEEAYVEVDTYGNWLREEAALDFFRSQGLNPWSSK